MLNAHDLSVVVQGPIHSSPENKGSGDVTLRCLATIRRFLPGAEIVLSTWKSAKTEGLDYDVLIQSEDPGAMPYTDLPGSLVNNVNRQITSTRAGLAAATRPHAIKFRGDLFLESGNVLAQDFWLKGRRSGGLFRARVVTSPFHTHNPRKHRPVAFHFSDIFQLGLTEDLRKLWSIPLAPEPETTRWLETHPGPFFFPANEQFKQRVHPEQYVILTFLSTMGMPFFFRHPFDISPRRLLCSERVLLENFQVLDLDQIGVVFPTRVLKSPPEAFFYRNCDWERLSRAYANPLTRWWAQADLLIQTYAGLPLRGLVWLFRRAGPRLLNRLRPAKSS